MKKPTLFKKLFLCCITIFISLSIKTQVTCDFENIILDEDTFWNGSDLSGNFIHQNVEFQNSYDTSFGGFWSSGWALSNRVDSTTITVDFNNFNQFLYNAKAGSGFNQSQNYLIGTQNSKIYIDSNSNRPKGVFITNSTYAYNSMKLGDSFAKKFGGSTGNDPDFFKLTIRKYKNGLLGTDSAYIYLADYRNPDNSQDYILRDWVYVPLEQLGSADSLLFTLRSSDTGTFGMNTPSYFALDQLSFDSTVSVSELTHKTIQLYPNPAKEYIYSSEMLDSYEILDLTGRMVMQSTEKNNNIHIAQLPKGIYILKAMIHNTIHQQRWIKD